MFSAKKANPFGCYSPVAAVFYFRCRRGSNSEHSKLVSSHHHRPNASHHIPRYLAFLFCFYLAFASPAANAIGAAADAAATAAAARAAAALGAGEGLGVALGGLGVAAAAVGAFALTFCATSYIMGTDLCSPNNPETGGGIAAAINDPSAPGAVVYSIDNIDGTFSSGDAACAAFNAAKGDGWWGGTKYVQPNCRGIGSGTAIAGVRATNNPNYDPNNPPTNSPPIAGDNIANNPRAAAGIGGAAAAKARGASDSAAESAARAAAAATGTGNPSRDRAAGNTAAAAGAAAAAAEAAGGSKSDVDKAAKDAAATAAAAADKAAPQDKTCQSNGASVDGRYCTDATAQPKPNSLPVFCTWAPSLCTLVDWVKQEPVERTQEQVIAQDNVIPQEDTYDNYNLPTNPQRSISVNFGGQCPSDVTIPLFMGIEWKFSYQAACEIAGYAKYAFVGAASITAIFIVTGNREPD